MDWQFPIRHKMKSEIKNPFRTKQQFINGLKEDIVFALVSTNGAQYNIHFSCFHLKIQ